MTQRDGVNNDCLSLYTASSRLKSFIGITKTGAYAIVAATSFPGVFRFEKACHVENSHCDWSRREGNFRRGSRKVRLRTGGPIGWGVWVSLGLEGDYDLGMLSGMCMGIYEFHSSRVVREVIKLQRVTLQNKRSLAVRY